MKNDVFSVYSSEEVLRFTYDAAMQVSNVEGVFIECGVAAGSQIAMLVCASIDSGTNKKVYGFDSFEGIPYATKEDDQQPGIGKKDMSKLGLLKTTGVSSHSVENVIDNFRKFKVPTDNVEFVKGWFQDTVQSKSKDIDAIALLRLDGDLYSSTKVCLHYLYDKVSIGGMVIIDDWQLPGCRKAVLEFIPEEKIVEHLGIAYFIK